MRYYNLTNILKKDAHYNLIIGERSNGKTYATLKYCVQEFVNNGLEFAYVRRWAEDIRGARGSQLFKNLEHNGEIKKLTKGEYTGVHYYTRKYFLCNYDDSGKAVFDISKPLGYAFALTESEHNKSVSYPNISTIVFDEFLTKKVYLPDEFIIFMETVSTILRKREGVKIFMLANTVNKYSPYFSEMGLTNILAQIQGTIDVYRYGESALQVAVEYCKPSGGKSKSKNDYYFAFNNPKLDMVTTGVWELDIYPHLKTKYKRKDIVFTYFIEFNDILYQCEIVSIPNNIFTFIHVKTTKLQKPDLDLVYSLDFSTKINYNRNIYKPINKRQERILWFFKTDNVCYSTNEVGNAIHNYLKICKRG